MPLSKTIIISCAGMGTRLGIGTTKALLDIKGKPLIYHQLELLRDYDDIRVVVGYQAEQLIDVVLHYRKDVLFIFNHDYRNNGTGASFTLGAQYANELVVSLDGDLLVHPVDLDLFLKSDLECVGGCTPTTDDPVFLQTEIKNSIPYTKAFSRQSGEWEWTGLTQIKSNRITRSNGHVFQVLEALLPLQVIPVRTKEIDTYHDYQNALRWVENGYCEVAE